DYYYKIDQSLYYLWSSFLDPHISYEALKDEFAGDMTLLDQLEAARLNLCMHFHAKYSSLQNTPESTCLPSTPSASMLSVTSKSTSTVFWSNGSPQKNFMARFQCKCAPVDELSEFWSLSQEDFQHCDPVQWWYGQ
ncbi:hypothetical protein BYT27DRAFT_7004095, partial [Phlegmacium glaucopus]